MKFNSKTFLISHRLFRDKMWKKLKSAPLKVESFVRETSIVIFHKNSRICSQKITRIKAVYVLKAYVRTIVHIYTATCLLIAK